MKDPMLFLRDFGGMVKAEIDKIKARIRSSFIGRLIWAVKNAPKDFKTKLPEYVFAALTTDQAKDFEAIFTVHGLLSLGPFYAKHPRGQFNLPPMSGDPVELAHEASKLLEAACDLLYLEIAEDGRRLYTAPNPFFAKLAEMSRGYMGEPQHVRHG